VQPGLTPKAVQEQSNCFVFLNGQVKTYNEEIACSHPTKLPEDVQGAVKALPMLQLLQKLPEDEIIVAVVEGTFLIRGKAKEAGLCMESEIHLPVDTVEPPGKWKKLESDFSEAVEIVQHCAGKDKDREYIFTCVHIHPEWLEACDNVQMVRYNIATPLDRPVLVSRDNLKHIVTMGMTRIAESEHWIHFKNPSGLTLSCLRYLEAGYRNLSPFFQNSKGFKAVAFPKGLAEATEKAEIFSAETTEKGQNKVIVELTPNKLRIKGQGINGYYTETKKVSWDGKSMLFMIAPQLLAKLVKQHPECQISSGQLKVEAEKFTYLSCLGEVKTAKEEAA
jgi:DNA polymerase III sliding clamp (beta) subunit (PCNA family)